MKRDPAPLLASELSLLRHIALGPAIFKIILMRGWSPDVVYRLASKGFVTSTRDAHRRGRPTTYRITDSGKAIVALFEGLV